MIGFIVTVKKRSIAKRVVRTETPHTSIFVNLPYTLIKIHPRFTLTACVYAVFSIRFFKFAFYETASLLSRP